MLQSNVLMLFPPKNMIISDKSFKPTTPFKKKIGFICDSYQSNFQAFASVKINSHRWLLTFPLDRSGHLEVTFFQFLSAKRWTLSWLTDNMQQEKPE